MILKNHKGEGGRAGEHGQPQHLTVHLSGEPGPREVQPLVVGMSLGNQRLCATECGSV